MKFSVTREVLLPALSIVSGVVEKRQTLPILSNLLLQLNGNSLTLTGTDLEVELRTTIEVEDAESGEITVTARKFLDICKALPESSKMQFTQDENHIILRSGRSRYTLSTLSANEFPLSDNQSTVSEFSIKQSELLYLINKTQFSMANQDVRYYLNGLLLETSIAKIRAVATDGHRLAICELNTTDDQKLSDGQIIIPRKAVVELSRLLENSDTSCHVSLGSNHIRVDLDTTHFSSKLIDGKFPDYNRVIPSQELNIMRCNKDTLRQMLHRTAILSNEKYRGIGLEISENLLIAKVHNPEHEEAEEQLDVEFNGSAVEIGFNVSYLLDVLGNLDEEVVEIGLIDANSSCIITGKDNKYSRYVVMPMRL